MDFSEASQGILPKRFRQRFSAVMIQAPLTGSASAAGHCLLQEGCVPVGIL